jgi:hypothetical protein
MRASHAIGPNDLLKVPESGGFVVKELRGEDRHGSASEI